MQVKDDAHASRDFCSRRRFLTHDSRETARWGRRVNDRGESRGSHDPLGAIQVKTFDMRNNPQEAPLTPESLVLIVEAVHPTLLLFDFNPTRNSEHKCDDRDPRRQHRKRQARPRGVPAFGSSRINACANGNGVEVLIRHVRPKLSTERTRGCSRMVASRSAGPAAVTRGQSGATLVAGAGRARILVMGPGAALETRPWQMTSMRVRIRRSSASALCILRASSRRTSPKWRTVTRIDNSLTSRRVTRSRSQSLVLRQGWREPRPEASAGELSNRSTAKSGHLRILTGHLRHAAARHCTADT